jgi:hypothetical protein
MALPKTDRREIANNGRPIALIDLTLALPNTSRQIGAQRELFSIAGRC